MVPDTYCYMDAPNFADLTATAQQLVAELARAVMGQETQIQLLLSAFLSGGHVLLEDFPGTGKTTLAKALAKTATLDFQRVQFTPDLLPSDILGVSIFNPGNQTFEFHKGPIFGDILLADEINRASPRTQSALLEAMAEGQVSIDGKFHRLPPHFFVIATQNPIEFHGTYPLPEAQMDRFAMRLGLGYVDLETELAMVNDARGDITVDTLAAIVDAPFLSRFRSAIGQIPVSKELLQYCISLVQSTRTHPALRLGASPRASISLVKCACALAILDGTHFVNPDHVQLLAPHVIAHRLVLDVDSELTGVSQSNVLAEIMHQVTVPR